MITQEQLVSYRDDARQLVAKLYKDEKGNPFILTDGQCDIFNLIFKKLTPRVHIESFTRYGKSETVAMAILTRICVFPEKWCIAAGNDDQAHIIIEHLIAHIFDNEFTKNRFVIGKGESEESIRRYRNKSKLNFKLEKGLLGEIFVTNAKGAMGYGSGNVVCDEAALIPDSEEALVFRMLGDQVENFYFKIGNPWDSGHFRGSAADPNFFKVKIDYWQGVREGRITPAFVDEVRNKPYFDVLYECKFPPLSQQDEEGWIPLLTKDEIARQFVYQWVGFGTNRLGGDVAGGGSNSSVLVQRTTNMARFLLKNQDPDTLNFGEKVLTYQAQLRTLAQDIFIDRVGIGKGVCDMLARQWQDWQGVNAGDKLATGTHDEQIYFNLRAKMFWLLRLWILGGGKLLVENEGQKEDWYQLAKIKYRQKLEGMRGKIQIMPKEKMLLEGIPSPDCADALALTFAREDEVATDFEVQHLVEMAEKRDFNPY